jgi:hypothetical protein
MPILFNSLICDERKNIKLGVFAVNFSEEYRAI